MPSTKDNNTLAKAAKDKYVEDLSKYTKVQLIELRDRQLKLLGNKTALKLPDKGERIQKFFIKLVTEIEARNEVDQAAELFSELNIVEKGVKAVTQMEWNNGKMNGDQVVVAADTLDSDDDEDEHPDPLKIIAQSRQTKLVKIVKPEKTLITEADLAEINAMTAENVETNNSNSIPHPVELEPHALLIINKDEEHNKGKTVKKFLPFKTTTSDVHSVEHEKERKHGKYWEVTAATPPTLRNSAAKPLSMHESIELERQHQEKLREQMEKQAEERLAARKKIISENISLLPAGSSLADPNSFFQSYRQREDKFNEDDEDDDNGEFSDNSDDGEEPEKGGIVVNLCD